jgi:hypothetical protein
MMNEHDNGLRRFPVLIMLAHAGASMTILKAMAKKNPRALAMARARARKLTPERRVEIARNAAETRWKGHIAKRPVCSRKKTSGSE